MVGAPVAAGLTPAGPSAAPIEPPSWPADPATVPQPDPVPQSPPAAPVPTCGTSPWVGYTAEDVGNGDFRLTGKRACVPGPNVLFQLRNADEVEHNLFASKGTDTRAIFVEVLPGETKEASAALAPGDWTLFCAIAGHGAMTRTLTVTG